MKVCKFGGSSLADAGQVGRVCDIVMADPDREVVVVSAPGKRHKDDAKVTDLLIACARSRLAGNSANEELEAVVARFSEIQTELGLADDVVEAIRCDLRERLDSDMADRDRFMDLLKAAGEDNCAKLVAEELKRRGVDARYVSPKDAGMLLSEEFGNARLLPESYDNLAKALSSQAGVIVFPGFFGYTKSGDVATFPRGGSDITGSILAAALKAQVYENFTDVDSVFAVDPRIVPNTVPIGELTYREMRELAYAGFGVLHDEAILPAVHAGIPICIKNTHSPEAVGTTVVLRHEHDVSRIVGIAGSDGFCTIYVNKYLMNREIGFGRKLLQIFEEEGLSYEHIPSGIDNLSIILKEASVDSDVEEHLMNRIRTELNVDDVGIERGLSLIMIVGEGMRYAVGMASKATRALAEAQVNIEMMNQGSSEISMMFGVKSEDRERALQSLYKVYFDEQAVKL